MTVFLIILAVIVITAAAVISISATFTITYDKKWKTVIQVLWIEKEIKLSKILSFVLFPKESAEKIKAENSSVKIKKKNFPKDKNKNDIEFAENESVISDNKSDSGNRPAYSKTDKPNISKNTSENSSSKPKKQNYIKTLWNNEGIVGIMSLLSNMVESASSALGTLFRDFHIYSFYVKILVGGADADEIARAYGRICKYYYPLKGAIINGMKVDNYDDWVAPDFIAPANEYGFQFIGSVSVGVLIKVLFSAGKTFLLNLIKNK